VEAEVEAEGVAKTNDPVEWIDLPLSFYSI